MRARILLGLGLVVAAGALASCAEEQVSAPPSVAPSFAKGNGRGGGDPDPCDPDKEICEAVGRMTGGGGQTVEIGDIYVTRGFTIHCDIILSNNLEINWPGNKWHIDKPLTSAQCIDDPAIDPEPPPAPFDTFIGEGVGRLNGVDGARAVFTFVDGGEPSGGGDKASFQVFDSNNVLVLNVPLSALTNGNIQAHYDQPHGSNVNR